MRPSQSALRDFEVRDKHGDKSKGKQEAISPRPRGRAPAAAPLDGPREPGRTEKEERVPGVKN